MSFTRVKCLYKLLSLTTQIEGQLKVDAVVFDLRLAKGCVDVAEQYCCRLPLVLTLCMTIRSTRILELWHRGVSQQDHGL